VEDFPGLPIGKPLNPYRKGLLRKVDRPVLTSLNRTLLILQTLFPFIHKTSYIIKEVNHTEPSFLVSVLWPSHLD